MSGHSKWSTIKRKKGAIDSERSKVFQKLAKELYVAAKSGDPNPENNPSLRMVIEKAKGENMPKANIESAINKAKNRGEGENYESIRYEGYGPHGIAIMIDCLTDNKNRTAGFVRSTLTKKGGNLGTDGSVSYLFERKGIIVLENVYDEDKIMEDYQFYSVEEVMKILKDKEKLLYVDDGCDEVVIKFEDLPDVIVDINTKSGMTDLKIYDYQNPSMTPLATTMGIFLDKCNPDLREKIIDRLIKLQQGEIEVKDYKMIDEYILEEARDKLEQEKKTKAKRNKEAR